jgi:hypothetical protein
MFCVAPWCGPHHRSCLALLPTEVTVPARVATSAVGSYPTVSPLPVPSEEGHRRSLLCCPYRRLAAPRCYLASCPVELGLSSRVGHRARPPATHTRPLQPMRRSSTCTCHSHARGPESRYRSARSLRESCVRMHWGGRTRTCNIPINSRVVCQLTYAPSRPRVRPSVQRAHRLVTNRSCGMPERGLEPRRLAAQPPQDCVSTNFTIRACRRVRPAARAAGFEPATG